MYYFSFSFTKSNTMCKQSESVSVAKIFASYFVFFYFFFSFLGNGTSKGYILYAQLSFNYNKKTLIWLCRKNELSESHRQTRSKCIVSFDVCDINSSSSKFSLVPNEIILFFKHFFGIKFQFKCTQCDVYAYTLLPQLEIRYEIYCENVVRRAPNTHTPRQGAMRSISVGAIRSNSLCSAKCCICVQ